MISLAADEKEIMEQVIDCMLASRCDSRLMMKQFASGSLLFIESGTKVVTNDRLNLSDVRRVRILGGPYEGREVWVQERVLR